jgi:hypothetical protein
MPDYSDNFTIFAVKLAEKNLTIERFFQRFNVNLALKTIKCLQWWTFNGLLTIKRYFNVKSLNLFR